MGKIRTTSSLTSTPLKDTRVTALGSRFYLNRIVSGNDNQVSKTRSVIALDPGVRTFMTAFEPNRIVDIASGSVSRLFGLRNTQYRLTSKLRVLKARPKKRLRKVIMRISRRIQHLVDEIHWKTINYCLKYDNIILPEFRVSQMTKRSKRKLSKRSVKEMLLLKHYQFRQRLIDRVKSTDKHLWIVNESYTSKTCSNCGCIHTKLGGNKTFDCPNCGVVLDRDVNGARNIFLKHCNIEDSLED
jgi:putative transposase